MARETFIHPSAIIEPGAELGAGVKIGPFCHVSSAAKLHDDVELIGHVTIMGDTTLGKGCQVFPQAVLGAPPQNFKHKGGHSTLEVGESCVIREGVTFHAGTDTSRGKTTVGSHGLFMAYSHVAHDSAVGNHVTMANYAGLGGHAEIGDHVIMSGYSAVHQFVRVGHHAFLGGFAAVVGDVIPYGMAVGDRACLRGLNIVGLKRSGMARDDIMALRKAYRMIFAEGSSLEDNAAAVEKAFPSSALVADLVEFVRGRDRRHFTLPLRGKAAAQDDDED
ncbi:UDP-N-acetylglucosamine acyltransferase [Nitratireductor indicus C115]|uniref:Acyl-[acyl-carrier-protein]--UDP-N-acetylglucosamine O-acyltransferase n=1 Tax=Nitratireductor indicus C115 TaxID=1231190 RepID=K2N8F1_9HYPH|nr:acyl-ACP--UDP-N-acetylglucosamine O-acyltransferase [Nitratireductor indicus]EKF43753.1 UDP-N-acetylglucosamine acyltransferase [Nitratireductor indicus C115]SFQ17607.1 acyl-[acyl-carrier-protein]--UDP-N-acetylglucosamine O-acyltransferase [Nitratireductor indicus]